MNLSEQDTTVPMPYDEKTVTKVQSDYCDMLKEMHTNKQVKTKRQNKPRCIYSTNGEFWEAFKSGKFTLEVKREDWAVFKVLAHFHGIDWSIALLPLLESGYPSFTANTDCLTFGCREYASMCWGEHDKKFVGDTLLRWEELDIDD